MTQQLIKNQILTNEVSYERKAKEILLAMRLEHFMEKDEILEAYLNIIPYGRNANGQNIAGIETAAEWHFRYKSERFKFTPSRFHHRPATRLLSPTHLLKVAVDRRMQKIYNPVSTG